ncbi:MAG: YceI family protein [Bacteroidia bacterium]
MKRISIAIVIMAVTIGSSLNAQSKFFTRNGNISFFSDGSSEKIDAVNHKVSCVIDATTGQIEFGVLMQAFEFEKALMQEHFNENYVESEKFPKATFKGTIADNNIVKYNADGIYKVNVTGKLTLHGVTNDVTSKGTITVKGGKVIANAEFKILLEEYKIEIPSLVKDKVAKDVRIVVDIQLDPLNK